MKWALVMKNWSLALIAALSIAAAAAENNLLASLLVSLLMAALMLSSMMMPLRLHAPLRELTVSRAKLNQSELKRLTTGRY